MRTFVLHSDTQAHALAIYLDANRSACAAAGKPLVISKVDESALTACLDAIAKSGTLDELKSAAKGFPKTMSDEHKARVSQAYTERKNCLERNESVHDEEADRFDAELN